MNYFKNPRTTGEARQEYLARIRDSLTFIGDKKIVMNDEYVEADATMEGFSPLEGAEKDLAIASLYPTEEV